jgi:hypothetical protein
MRPRHPQVSGVPASEVADDEPMGLGQVGDDPIASADTLDRHPLAVKAADLIRTVADSSPSLAVGLIGPWGSGRTSVLARISEEIEKDERA